MTFSCALGDRQFELGQIISLSVALIWRNKIYFELHVMFGHSVFDGYYRAVNDVDISMKRPTVALVA